MKKSVKKAVKKIKLKKSLNKAIGLKEQVNLFTKAVESTADGIFMLDAKNPAFPVVYANPSFRKMTGYEKNEIIGENYFALCARNIDNRIIDDLKQALNRGKSFHKEVFSFQKRGKKYWNLLRMSVVRGRDGAVTHYIGMQTDITLMRKKEQEIDEQLEELLHLTRIGKLAEFVSALAHEICQPLTSILSYAQAGQRMLAGKDSKLQEVLQYIVNDDHRAVEVIGRLRLLLKKNKTEIKLINVNHLINETIRLISTDAAVRGISLKLELDRNLPLVRGDQVQLQQVILNLVSNSFDALKDVVGLREILIRTLCNDADTIRVEVADSGCGIPAQNILKLFTHFFTSKSDGLGMGLSISRSIIEAHGGKLEMKNNSQHGVTFYFTIPINKKDAQ